MARAMLPGGNPAEPGSRMRMGAYADSLRLVQAERAAALHGGALGQALIDRLRTDGPETSVLSLEDLISYSAVERDAIFGSYRGYTIAGPPPPASSGVHVVQMLNMLENHDIRSMGFGSVECLHLMAQVIRVAFEDRRAASGDPDFVDVPVERYTSKDYARECLDRIQNRRVPDATAGQ